MWITAVFQEAGTPKTGLTPLVTVYDLADNSIVVNAAAMSEVGLGWYKYAFAGYDQAKDYAIYVDGGVALDALYRYVYAAKVGAQVGEEMDLIDAPNSTAMEAIGTAIWATTARSLTTFGSLVSDISTAVWSAVSRTLTEAMGGLTAQETRDAMKLSPSAGDPEEGSIDDLLQAHAGIGSSVLDVAVMHDETPIAGVIVEVYLTEEKTGLVRRGTSNTSGIAHFDIDPGTYYVWVMDDDYEATNPTEVEVT
jgi:hypothetical protein